MRTGTCRGDVQRRKKRGKIRWDGVCKKTGLREERRRNHQLGRDEEETSGRGEKERRDRLPSLYIIFLARPISHSESSCPFHRHVQRPMSHRIDFFAFGDDRDGPDLGSIPVTVPPRPFLDRTSTVCTDSSVFPPRPPLPLCTYKK